MDEDLRLRRRLKFDEHPESYLRARSGYPPKLLEDLRSLGQIRQESHILEIGCGPGTLTRSLAEFGCEVVALELGPHLAELARYSLGEFPKVTVITASFDDWPIPASSFDLVTMGASFHWLDPTTRMSRILAALKPGGHVAVPNRHRINSGDSELERAIQECYLRWDPDSKPGYRPPEESEVNPEVAEISADPNFTAHTFRRYPRENDPFTPARYRDLLNTYSDFLLLEPEVREGLADCLTALIDSRCNGVYQLPLLATLHVAEKRSN